MDGRVSNFSIAALATINSITTANNNNNNNNKIGDYFPAKAEK
jgi:hypothetical protein